MTEHIQSNTDSPLINMLFQYGLSEGMPKIAELIVNTAMLIERSQHLQANSYQRSPERTGYANGFKKKSLHTSMGKLDLHIPQVRDADSPFYPSLLEKGSRVDQALKLSIAEMYLQGISTRKVSNVLQELCGMEVSSSQVSVLTARLDPELTQWRERRLSPVSHMILDATYLKVREDSCVRSCAVLIAVGICR